MILVFERWIRLRGLLLLFNSFQTSFLIPICNYSLQSLVSLKFWTNMRILSWLAPMPEIVFFVIKIVHRPMYKFMKDNWKWYWYTMRASHVYWMLHQRSINSFSFTIASAKIQVIHYSNKLFRSTCVLNSFWLNSVYCSIVPRSVLKNFFFTFLL